ncbi:MAG: NAD(P)H-dependent oxidoreductase [Ruminiclostridium sp.]|nr:NAD(P)H-dependent oxidoreductase [Ruminiclostridium sp.]
MKILFINACVREKSRTLVYARKYLENADGDITEIVLQNENILPLDKARLEKRDRLIAENKTDDEMLRYARQFAQADEIVIAAPYWDLGFPALLKIYIEAISVSGITFTYERNIPKGLCKAKRLVYITTAGGRIYADFGYNYVKMLAQTMYGIRDTKCIYAENLDVECIPCEKVTELVSFKEKE